MPPELTFLALTAILTLVHPSVQGLVLKAEVGNAWTVGARDRDAPRQSPLSDRARRATMNFLETVGAFVAATLVLHLGELATEMTRAASIIYLVGRAIYLPAYISGIPWFRTLVWNVATAGLALVIAGIWWHP